MPKYFVHTPLLWRHVLYQAGTVLDLTAEEAMWPEVVGRVLELKPEVRSQKPEEPNLETEDLKLETVPDVPTAGPLRPLKPAPIQQEAEVRSRNQGEPSEAHVRPLGESPAPLKKKRRWGA